VGEPCSDAKQPACQTWPALSGPRGTRPVGTTLHVVTEAIARIDGWIGLLGEKHAGDYFEPSDTPALAGLFCSPAATEKFLSPLTARSRKLAGAWQELLREEEKGGDMAELRLTQLVQGGG
jgi:hypothetical protein